MSDALNPQYPVPEDKEVAQLVVYASQIHSASYALKLDKYNPPSLHGIGETLHMMQALAHDMEWLAEGLYLRYQKADESERAARLVESTRSIHQEVKGMDYFPQVEE